MAPAKARPSAFDRFTDASSTAISSGFSAAMQIGAQPQGLPDSFNTQSEGADWLKDLQMASGMEGGDDDAGMGEGYSDEDDVDSEAESTSGRKKGKKGRGKVKNGKGANYDSPAAQRKAQNRIAQREFRQRKQQYIRALEARVEVLSSEPNAQADRLRFALRGLLAENNQLRSMLGSLGGFIGFQNVGGHLQKAGMSREELFGLILGSGEKTLTELWQNWPGARENEALRQLRLEANLPPEGLPESHQLPIHVPSSMSKQGTNSSEKSKDAAVADEGNGKGTKTRTSTKRKAGMDDIGKESTDLTQLTQSTMPDTVQSQMQQPGSGGFDDTVQDQSAKLLSLLSQYNIPMGQMTGNMPTSFNDISSPSQDSNALMTSLFGVNGMRGLMFDTGMTPGLQQSTPFSIDNMSTFSNTVNGRLKTVPGGEEPEESRRLAAFASKIRVISSLGPAKEENELSRVIDGLSQLIREMSNFRRSPSYKLPSLLEPTDVQQTRPHDPLIDALPFAGLRQRLILQQDNLLIDNVVLSFLYHAILHPGDAMDSANWEIKEEFLTAFPQLIDKTTLAITNSWRLSKGQGSLSLIDIAFRMS